MNTKTMTPAARAEAMATILYQARALMNHHGLHGWTLKISRGKTTAGHCFTAGKEIALSGVLLPMWPAADVRDTILHEIAHALTPKDPGHGPEWRRVCVAIGGSPARTFPAHLPTPKRAGVLRTCECVGRETLHARRKDDRCWMCNARYLWRKDGEPLTAAKPYSKRWSENETIDIGLALGATRDGGGLKAPKGKIWEMTESHYVDCYSSDADALEQFRSDIEGGFTECHGDCWSCKE